MIGAEAAGQAALKAEADEMAASARGAQRRAIAAAKAAKEAADKVNIAANIANVPDLPLPTLPPCDPKIALLQTNGKQPQGCSLLPESMTTDNNAVDAMVEKQAGLPSGFLNEQGQVPDFLRNMLQNSASQIRPPALNVPQQVETIPQQRDDSANDPRGGPDSTQSDFTPGMLSTIQTRAKMHGSSRGTSRKV